MPNNRTIWQAVVREALYFWVAYSFDTRADALDFIHNSAIKRHDYYLQEVNCD